MNKKTILQLNKLNAEFYNTIASEFSQTRSYYWQGWKKLIGFFEEKLKQHQKPTVLDLGCGNGRFAQFLYEHLKHPFLYIGSDNCTSLLKIAKKNLSKIPIELQFIKADLIKDALSNNLTNKINHKRYHLITLFGVMHHVPSFELRKQLIHQLSKMLTHDGHIIFTMWQFTKDERIFNKRVNPNKVGIDPDTLEEDDFILDWKRGKTAYRYCHCTQHAEMEKLIEESDLEVADQFYSDGKSNQLNFYAILRRKSEK